VKSAKEKSKSIDWKQFQKQGFVKSAKDN
jgi:hypothetical protein